MTIHSNSNFSFSSSFSFTPSVFTDDMPKDVLSADRDLFQSCNRLEDEVVVDRLPSATKFYGEQGDDLFQEIFEDLEAENARAAFNHGEVGIGNYNHATEMSGLDRMIFEDCNPGSGGIQRVGMNLPKTPRNQRPEVLAADINKAVGQLVCSIERAGDLIDFWKIIAGDADGYKALHRQFRDWTVKSAKSTGKLTASLKYFHDMAAELVDTTSLQEPEDCDIPVQAIVDGKYVATGEVMTSDWYQAEVKTEITAEEWDAVVEQRSWVDEEGNRHLDAHMTEATPDVLRYQNFAYQTGNEPDWIESQPIWYKELIKSAKSSNVKKLKALAEWVSEHKLTKQQGWIFWDIYRRRMAAFDKRLRKNLSDTAKIIISRIRNASPRKLGFIGFWLHDQQNNGGKTQPLKHPVKPEEYRLLWKEYKQMKL